MRSAWSTAVYEESLYRLHFEEPNFVYANENIAANRAKAKDGDIAVVMGVKNLHGRQFDLHLQSREQAHDVLLIGWSWTGKITLEPEPSPAWKQPRLEGASEHKSSGASEHKRSTETKQSEEKQMEV